MMYMFMLTINMLFLMMNHPMSMGLMLIVQTIMISINSGILMKTFWMSYMLTITMLSGMLVLFIYMSSVASNEKFKNNMYMWMYIIIMMITSMMFLSLLNKMIIKNNYWGMEMLNMKMNNIYFLNKLFNSMNMMVTIMMVIYLLITMIVSSYLVNISEGPMRLKI